MTRKKAPLMDDVAVPPPIAMKRGRPKGPKSNAKVYSSLTGGGCLAAMSPKPRAGRQVRLSDTDGAKTPAPTVKKRSTLPDHKRAHTSERPYKCDFLGSGYITTQRCNLATHKRTHTSERPYKCDFPSCKYAASRTDTLAEHKRAHTGERPYKCDFLGCDYTTTHRCNLVMHKRAHTGERPYKCDPLGCEYAAARRSSLAHHSAPIHA